MCIITLVIFVHFSYNNILTALPFIFHRSHQNFFCSLLDANKWCADKITGNFQKIDLAVVYKMHTKENHFCAYMCVCGCATYFFRFLIVFYHRGITVYMCTCVIIILVLLFFFSPEPGIKYKSEIKVTSSGKQWTSRTCIVFVFNTPWNHSARSSPPPIQWEPKKKSSPFPYLMRQLSRFLFRKMISNKSFPSHEK